MNRQLYRFTPAAGKPNNCTDSLASAGKGCADTRAALLRLEVGDLVTFADGTWERIA